MLFLLEEGWLLLGAAIGLLVGIVAQGVGQTLVASRLLGDRQAVREGRQRPDPRSHLDPFGVVVALLGRPPLAFGKAVPFAEPRFGSKSRYVVTALSGSIVHLLVGLIFLVAMVLAGGDLVEGVVLGTTPAQQLLGMAGFVNVGSAVLRLLPFPPLDGNRILWAYAPRTEGWLRARRFLEDQNGGLAILVVLLLPIFGDQGLLSRVAVSVTRAVLRLAEPLL